MKSIMSVNYKFMEFNPLELITIVMDNSNSIAGFEMSINYKDEIQLKYLNDLSFLCKKYGLHLQIHGDSQLPVNEQLLYIEKLENISDYLGYPINVVLHPLNLETKDESITKTIEYMDSIISKSDFNKVVISLENLNNNNFDDRLNKEDITSIILNNEQLFMTYDIGHEIIDNGNITDVNKFLFEKISNIHIHTYNDSYSNGYDHKPIYKHDKHWNLLLKGIEFLKVNKYTGSIVFEYDLYACLGKDLKEKIISYCQSIDNISERLK